jgi:hypothetical protein
MKLGLKITLIGTILVSLFLSAWWLINGNLMFHSDIARDFWLMKDIVDNRHLTLIGPRAGGIEGVFHGPLWLYLNLPAYVIGRGNPVVVGWFWWMLNILTLVIVFLVSKKMFGKNATWWAVAVMASVTILDVHSYINPQGALIVMPLFFYFYWKYSKNKKISDLVISLFLAGLMVQFEIGIGGPILILTVLDNVLRIIKDKKWGRWMAYLILIIPFSSYFIFELRHNFLQTRSVLKYFEAGGSGGAMVYFQILVKRFQEMIGAVGILTKNNILTGLAWLMVLWLFIKNKSKKIEGFNLLVFFYVGFWVMTIVFRGEIQNYYYIAFLPVLAIVLAGGIVKNKVILGKILLTLIIINGIWIGFLDTKNYSNKVGKQDVSTWKVNEEAAKWVMDRAKGEFGYYIYTPDLYGYGLGYALDFLDKANLGKRDEKLEKTFLIMDPNVKENINGRENWKSGEVKIDRKADDQIELENGVRVEEFNLSESEMKVESNPFLIKDVFFR